MKISHFLVASTLALASAAYAGVSEAQTIGQVQAKPLERAKHVLLISVDGMHEQDLARFIATHPESALAELAQHAIVYRRAMTPVPSDSFPGMVALITGASPRNSGIYYDDSYARDLSPAGSDCTTRGTEVVYDDSIDRNAKQIDGGGGIDPARLPRDPAHGCRPVYPYAFLRVNTVFEVIHQAGGHTAWVDKHLAYDFVSGPSGKGVDDLYTPEIAAVGEKLKAFPAYDHLKVDALLKQIDGRDSSGTGAPGVPMLFGMNFQNLSVAQKSGDGYLDARAAPGQAITGALAHIDHSLQRLTDALKNHDLYASTLVVITSKHGQSPVDPALLKRIDGKRVIQQVNSIEPELVAKASLDDVGLLWLKDQRHTAAAVAALRAQAADLGIAHVYAGNDMPAGFGRAARDSRTPDIVIEVVPGVVYTRGKKMAEHGGMAEDDRHVALMLSRPDIKSAEIDTPVETQQVAPTVLHALGMDPGRLQAVKLEGTTVLPGAAIIGARR